MSALLEAAVDAASRFEGDFRNSTDGFRLRFASCTAIEEQYSPCTLLQVSADAALLDGQTARKGTDAGGSYRINESTPPDLLQLSLLQPALLQQERTACHDFGPAIEVDATIGSRKLLLTSDELFGGLRKLSPSLNKVLAMALDATAPATPDRTREMDSHRSAGQLPARLLFVFLLPACSLEVVLRLCAITNASVGSCIIFEATAGASVDDYPPSLDGYAEHGSKGARGFHSRTAGTREQAKDSAKVNDPWCIRLNVGVDAATTPWAILAVVTCATHNCARELGESSLSSTSLYCIRKHALWLRTS